MESWLLTFFLNGVYVVCYLQWTRKLISYNFNTTKSIIIKLIRKMQRKSNTRQKMTKPKYWFSSRCCPKYGKEVLRLSRLDDEKLEASNIKNHGKTIRLSKCLEIRHLKSEKLALLLEDAKRLKDLSFELLPIFGKNLKKRERPMLRSKLSNIGFKTDIWDQKSFSKETTWSGWKEFLDRLVKLSQQIAGVMPAETGSL